MTVSRSKGFTLIEALVAVLVLSIGLLGVAAMQLKALQSAHVSYQRTTATLAAQDAVERLWINLGEKTVQDCPTAGTAGLQDWKDDWSAHLDLRTVTTIQELTASCDYEIIVGWSDERFADESQAEGDATQGLSTLHYRMKLPKYAQ